jgi:hypothetical protein
MGIPRGKVAKEVKVLGVRGLTREDLPSLQGRRESSPSRVQKFRASHHYVAMLYGEGRKTAEVMALTGYSQTRLSTLLQAPAFQDLIASNRKAHIEKAEHDQYVRNLKEIAIKSQRHILDHYDELDELGELMPAKTALALASDSMDRIGYGKHSSSTVAHVNYADELERRVRTINAEPTPSGPGSTPQEGPKSSAPPAVFKRRV